MCTINPLNYIRKEQKIAETREVVMKFKSLTGRPPNYLASQFTIQDNASFSLRSNNHNLVLHKPKTKFLKKSFANIAAKHWNELPFEVTNDFQNLSVNSIKHRLITVSKD